MKKNKLNPEIWQNDMPDMNDDLMWLHIEKELDNDKSKPFIFYWLSTAILIFVFGIIVFLVKMNNIDELNTINSNSVTINTVEKKESIINTSSINNLELNNELTEIMPVITTKSNRKINLNIKQSSFPLSNNSINIQKSFSNKGIELNNNQSKLKALNDLKQSEGQIRFMEVIPLIINNPKFVLHIEKGILEKQILLKHILNDDFNKNRDNSIFVLGFSGMGRLFSNTKYNDNIQWQNRKFSNEKALYNFIFSTQIARPIYKKLFISLGFQYQNIVVNYKETTDEVFVEKFLSDSAFVIKNSDIFLPGERIKTTTINKRMSYYNEIRHFSIPWSVGYVWSNKRNSFILSTGLLFRFNSNFTGYTISSENKIDKYENMFKNINKHLGISQVEVSGFYGRSFNNNIDFLLGVNYIHSHKPDYSINSSFINKYSSINLSTGFKFKF